MKLKTHAIVLVAILLSQGLPVRIAGAQTESRSNQPFDPIVTRLKNALKLSEQQVVDARKVFSKHATRIAELRTRAQENPYNPQLPPEIDKEQREIREELSAILDSDQKARLMNVDTRLPIPVAPPFRVINIPPAERSSVPSTSGPFAERERIVPGPANSSRTRRGQLTDDQKILHLLDRITFGPRPGDLDLVRRMTPARFIESQLEPDSIDDSDAARRLAVLPTQQMSTFELWQFYPPPNLILERSKQPNPPPVFGRPQQVMGEMVQQKLVRAVSSNRQLLEVLTDFWFNHFNVFAPKGADQWLVASYERDAIRPHSLGKFRDLLTAVAQSPAMLFYLDNWLSFAPNAREPRPPGPPRTPGPPNNLLPRPAYPTTSQPEMMQPPAMRPAAEPAKAPITDLDLKARVQSGGQPPSSPQMKMEGDQKPQNLPPRRPPARKRDINENYARELLELHTLGVDGGYSQKDVQEVARCFTGWTIDRPFQGGTFVFKPWMHDQGAKTVLGITIPAGGGMSDGLKVIDILSRHPSTARFISKKLCERFVSDDPPVQLVERIAQVFLRTDGDIGQVMRAILTSTEFNSSSAFRSKLKSPLELAASAIRALDGQTNGGPGIHDWLRKMGEPLYQNQFPTGFSENSRAWMNTGVFFNRINFGVALANNLIGGTRYDPASVLSSGITTDEAIKQLSALLLHARLSDQSLKAVQDALAQQGTRPGDAHRQLIGLLLGTPEFQKR